MILVNFFQQAIFLGVGSFEPVISVLNFEVRCSENFLDNNNNNNKLYLRVK